MIDKLTEIKSTAETLQTESSSKDLRQPLFTQIIELCNDLLTHVKEININRR